MILEVKGIEVEDLVADVAPVAFIKAYTKQSCKILCCSALSTTTMNVMRDMIKVVEDAGIHDRCRS